jgi:bifunctional DNA-binding transcriptional regulator/antitoxin component of YhaV-PrlF toxin-antitoxin module
MVIGKRAWYHTNVSSSEIIAVVRKRNQLTLPSDAVDILGVVEGDRLIIELKPGERSAILRPVRRSYAGALRGVYGEAGTYTAAERDSWR